MGERASATCPSPPARPASPPKTSKRRTDEIRRLVTTPVAPVARLAGEGATFLFGRLAVAGGLAPLGRFLRLHQRHNALRRHLVILAVSVLGLRRLLFVVTVRHNYGLVCDRL